MATTTKNGIIQLHIGHAGVMLANSCWEIYCLEHGITPVGCQSCDQRGSRDHGTFFAFDGSSVTPRVVLLDTAPEAIDEIRSGNYKYLFSSDNYTYGKQSASNNYACGYYGVGKELKEIALDRIRKIAETCNNVQGIMVIRSGGGGTGSGFSTLLLEQLDDDYHRLPKMDFTIFPSPNMSSIIVEPYNAILATHCGMDYTEGTILLENESCFNMCKQLLQRHDLISYSSINKIMAQVITTITCPLRFEGEISLDFDQLIANIVPYPRIHYPTVSYSPLTSNSRLNATGKDLAFECFNHNNQLVACNPSKGKYVSLSTIFRGDISPGEIQSIFREIKSKKLSLFLDWSPTDIKPGLNYIPPTTVPNSYLAPTGRACCMVGNNTNIRDVWGRMLDKYKIMFAKKAFVHHYVNEGLEEDTMKEAKENIETLIEDYKEVESDFDQQQTKSQKSVRKPKRMPRKKKLM